MPPRLPELLRPGARLTVWAPSSPGPVLFPRRFQRGLDALRKAGYVVSAAPSCESTAAASTRSPRELAAELHEALGDGGCDGLVAAVGGWTLLAVLPYVDFELVGAAGKPLIGYSDLTVLLNAVTHLSGLVTFHGPMVLPEWGEPGGPWPYTEELFRGVVHAEQGWDRLVVPEASEWSDELLWWDRDDTRPRAPVAGGETRQVLTPGVAEGRLWGGSLLALGLLAGTPYWPDPTGSLVFLEAEGIAPDELLARLEQLRRIGVFDAAAGVLFGRFSRPRPTAAGFADLHAVIRDVVGGDVPLATGFDLGHTDPMVTLPIGGSAELSCPSGGTPELTLLRP